MKPGFTINFPKNMVDEKTKAAVYASSTVSSSWTRKTNEGRDVH